MTHLIDHTRHDRLVSMLHGQFNMDWDRDYSQWQDAVDELIHYQPANARKVLDALDELVPQLETDADADALLSSIHFDGWLPDRMGDSKLAWLRALRQELADRLTPAVDTRDDHLKGESPDRR